MIFPLRAVLHRNLELDMSNSKGTYTSRSRSFQQHDPNLLE
jgi:hypothetical protein